MTGSIICDRCGDVIPRRSVGHKRCETCSEAIRIERYRERYPAERRYGATFSCVDCDAAVERVASGHKRCRACARKIGNERRRDHGRRRTASRRAAIPCVDCGERGGLLPSPSTRCKACAEAHLERKREGYRRKARAMRNDDGLVARGPAALDRVLLVMRKEERCD